MSKPIIKTHKLSKIFPNQKGVFDLDLEVREGEVFGYLGPNGAGKTTTIRMLLDFARPTSGQATIFGLDTRKESVEIKRQIGFLPGELALYDNLNGADFLRYMGSLRGKVKWDFVESLASRLQMNLRQSISTLSHGNKQKLGLVQAFMHKPKLLILDEPTQGLDPLIQHEFYHLIEEVKTEGRSVFLSSHDLPEVERVCDRVGIIKSGKLIKIESIKSLKEKALRPIEVQFNQAVNSKDFLGLNLEELRVEKNILHCVVKGSMDPFIKCLAKYDVGNIVTKEPNLEEIFLKFYEKEPNAA